MKKSLIDIAKECIEIEQKALISLANHLENSFEVCVKDIFDTKARVVCTGIGKSALVAQKIVATMNSTGTPAAFLHAADAVHGDIGILNATDFLCCLSKSGETEEIKLIVPLAKHVGCKIIAITSNKDSYLARQSDYLLFTPIEKEADPNNLAPTASTAAQMAMGDAIAICLLYLRGFTPEDFARFHPGGSLGKQLYLHVYDVYPLHGKPMNNPEDDLAQVILNMSKNRMGATVIVDHAEQPVGIVTDGDLRRLIENKKLDYTLTAKQIMNPDPRWIDADALAINALDMMRQNHISQLVVTKSNQYVGMIHLHDLVKEGLL
ncbi:MAG: KpsF/GutQ family sugar-phosphate isomerase [Saprospiraceae bacterium]